MVGLDSRLWALIELELGTQGSLAYFVLRFVPRKGGIGLVQRNTAGCRRVTSKHKATQS